MPIKNLKFIYYLLILIAVIMNFGTDYLDDFISWQKGYDITTVELPFIYYYNYGTYPLKYYYLKFLRIDLYLLWGLSLYCMIKGIKIKIWKINITFPIFISLTCLIVTMLTLARMF